MATIIARLEITQDDTGLVNVAGTGRLMNQKAFAYGLLELAKDIIRQGNSGRGVEGASLADLPH